jgi:L-lysine 6-oxidase
MTETRFAIHPTIAVARVGNSQDSFYLAPEVLEGLPIECDADGSVVLDSQGLPSSAKRFKDESGRIRRQGARFKVFAYDADYPEGREVTLDDPAIASLQWTVHLANKKAIWYQTDELKGNLMLGQIVDGQNTNSYQAWDVPFRNAKVTDPSARRRMITDPGPRSVSEPSEVVEISRTNIPPDYPHGSFPPPDLGPYPINTLGRLQMDPVGRLIVLGGHGRASGKSIIATYTGGDEWWDDISDGPVNCKVTLVSGETFELKAWVIVGPPKFAPELRNITNLADVMFDIGVRFFGLVPELYDGKQWSDTYEADFHRDILPLMERPGDYIWSANVPSMAAFVSPRFDAKDPSPENRPNRERYFSYWRPPGTSEVSPSHSVLFKQGVPLMPMNSGSNSVTNENSDKFMSTTQTQWHLLKLWAEGRFQADKAAQASPIHPLDLASVATAVGHPMSPGIEVSWNLRNPAVYANPFQILHRVADYRATGLSLGRDECEGGGCEPGDLTKRMSPPWQSDMYQCFIQYVNFTDPKKNRDDLTSIPPPPTFYTYWWPPAVPINVVSGADTPAEQAIAGIAAGYQVYFPRGADNIQRLITSWKYMGFILNQNEGPDRHLYPYFVERERNHDKFRVASIAVGSPVNLLAASGQFFTADNYFIPMWYPEDGADLG